MSHYIEQYGQNSRPSIDFEHMRKNSYKTLTNTYSSAPFSFSWTLDKDIDGNGGGLLDFFIMSNHRINQKNWNGLERSTKEDEREEPSAFFQRKQTCREMTTTLPEQNRHLFFVLAKIFQARRPARYIFKHMTAAGTACMLLHMHSYSLNPSWLDGPEGCSWSWISKLKF